MQIGRWCGPIPYGFLRIPRWNPLRRLRWTTAMDDLLGTAPDAEIATMLDLPVAEIRDRRRRMGL